MKNCPPSERLTARETEVLSLAAQGKKHKEIAAKLDLSDLTVRSHLANIREKFNVGNTTGAVTMAIGRGIISI